MGVRITLAKDLTRRSESASVIRIADRGRALCQAALSSRYRPTTAVPGGVYCRAHVVADDQLTGIDPDDLGVHGGLRGALLGNHVGTQVGLMIVAGRYLGGSHYRLTRAGLGAGPSSRREGGARVHSPTPDNELIRSALQGRETFVSAGHPGDAAPPAWLARFSHPLEQSWSLTYGGREYAALILPVIAAVVVVIVGVLAIWALVASIRRIRRSGYPVPRRPVFTQGENTTEELITRLDKYMEWIETVQNHTLSANDSKITLAATEVRRMTLAMINDLTTQLAEQEARNSRLQRNWALISITVGVVAFWLSM